VVDALVGGRSRMDGLRASPRRQCHIFGRRRSNLVIFPAPDFAARMFDQLVSTSGSQRASLTQDRHHDTAHANFPFKPPQMQTALPMLPGSRSCRLMGGRQPIGSRLALVAVDIVDRILDGRDLLGASSGISTPNSSSNAMTSSTMSRLSAPRSSMKLASSVTLSARRRDVRRRSSSPDRRSRSCGLSSVRFCAALASECDTGKQSLRARHGPNLHSRCAQWIAQVPRSPHLRTHDCRPSPDSRRNRAFPVHLRGCNRLSASQPGPAQMVAVSAGGDRDGPSGNIHFHPESSLWSEDFSKENMSLQGLFIHEMTHVWQAQTRGRWYLPLMRHPFCRYSYQLGRRPPIRPLWAGAAGGDRPPSLPGQSGPKDCCVNFHKFSAIQRFCYRNATVLVQTRTPLFASAQ
jgi:hypothetical protein